MEHGILITYSWGDAEEPIQCASLKEAWEQAKQLVINEAEEAAAGWDADSIIHFDLDNNKIILNYTYDNTFCYYQCF